MNKTYFLLVIALGFIFTSCRNQNAQPNSGPSKTFQESLSAYVDEGVVPTYLYFESVGYMFVGFCHYDVSGKIVFVEYKGNEYLDSYARSSYRLYVANLEKRNTALVSFVKSPGNIDSDSNLYFWFNTKTGKSTELSLDRLQKAQKKLQID